MTDCCSFWHHWIAWEQEGQCPLMLGAIHSISTKEVLTCKYCQTVLLRIMKARNTIRRRVSDESQQRRTDANRSANKQVVYSLRDGRD